MAFAVRCPVSALGTCQRDTVVLAVAQILSAMQTPKGADTKAYKYIMCICVALISPIALENLSTAILLFSVVYMMMFIGLVPRKLLLRTLAAVVGAVVFVLLMVLLVGNADNVKESDPKNNLTEQTVQGKEENRGLIAKLFHRADTWEGAY